jgi:hypothetical protein
MQALCLFTLPAKGFRHRDLRPHIAALRGLTPKTYGHGPMTYDLRRLRLHGLIERIPRTHRYQLTPTGATAALFYVRFYQRVLRPAFSVTQPDNLPTAHAKALLQLARAVQAVLQQAQLAA